jgi:CheY-like chemotaxis protein
MRMSLNIQQTSAFITSLLNNMLDLAKIDAGKMVLCRDNVDLFDVIDDLCRLSLPLKPAGVELKTSFTKDGVECQRGDTDFCIMADAQRWRQVLLNLVSNALRFTSSGYVHISVVIFTAKRLLRVSVMDTGPGISASDAARLFQKYEQVHNTGPAGGSGLGLVLAQKIATLWGSTIEIQSPWQERKAGSMFHFTMKWAPYAYASSTSPLQLQNSCDAHALDTLDVQQASPDQQLAAAVEILKAKLTGATVLLVEDEALNTLLMTTKLTKSSELAKYKLDVSPLSSADEAMALLQADPSAFDIIIMDEHFEFEKPTVTMTHSCPTSSTGGTNDGRSGGESSSYNCTPTPDAADDTTADEIQIAIVPAMAPTMYVLGSDPTDGLAPIAAEPWRPLRGSEAIKQLREMGCTSAIISCSGNCLDDDTAAYRNAGATISWPKPYPAAVDMERDLLKLCSDSARLFHDALLAQRISVNNAGSV